ncbi:MAG: DUF1499 domain-containing protein [Pontixanthobacter sp.]
MKFLRILPRIALALAILLIIWFLVALFGAKLGMIDKLTAFGTMTVGIGASAAMVVAAIAAVALIVSFIVKPRAGWGKALVALIIPLAVLAGFNQLRATAESVPFIYDVTTDPAEAPQFSADMVRLREQQDANPLMEFDRPLGTYEKWEGNADLADVTSAQLIAEEYPTLEPLQTQNTMAETMAAVEAAMDDAGITNLTVDQAAGTVEGTAIVFWYGFEDDVIARIRQTPAGSQVDFRSTSRLGTSDLGVNAQRIAELREDVAARLD